MAAASAAPPTPLTSSRGRLQNKVADKLATEKHLAVAESEKQALGGWVILPSCGWETVQGRRPDQQDSLVALDDISLYNSDVELAEPLSFWAMFDGHGGREVSSLLETTLLDVFLSSPSVELVRAGKYEEALTVTFARVAAAVDSQCVKEHWSAGSTATVVLLAGRRLYVANLGDTEVLLGRRSSLSAGASYLPTVISYKHTAEDVAEQLLAERRGASFSHGRLGGRLAVTRAFGDVFLRAAGRADKQDWISCEPFVRAYDLCARDDFLVVACDGLFDILDAKKIGAVLKKCFAGGASPDEAAALLVEKAMKKQSKDNISVIVVYLLKSQVATQSTLSSMLRDAK